MEKRFAIFDLDGTLVDSMRYWMRLGSEYLQANGITSGTQEILRQVQTETMADTAALFSRTFPRLGSPEQVLSRLNQRMDDHYRLDIPLKAGAAAYLRGLVRRGVTLCVASATDTVLIRDCLTRLGVADCFAFFLSCEEVQATKIRPDVYLEAARRLGAEPAQIAVYEDAPYALRTAKNAGFYTVAVYDAFSGNAWPEVTAIAEESIRDWRDAVL